jgi:hypothetical protein
VLVLNLDGWKARRQSAACHHMLGTDCVRPGVEIDEITCRDIDGADAEANLAGIESIEVYQALQGAFENSGIVEASRINRSCRV